MRAATQAAWLQVVAAREQLDVRKALRQLVVIPLRYSLVCNGKCALTANATFVKQRHDESHLLFLVNMGIIIDKLFGGGGPMVEADTAGSCTSKCCDTEVVSEVSSSSSEHTHASLHALSRPSFETLPPGHAESRTK